MADDNAELDLLKIDMSAEEGAPEADEPEYSDVEMRAMDDGWRPESEWEGDASEWVGAKEFNFRGELMSRISSQTGQLADNAKKVEELSAALKVLGDHHKKTAETEHKKILATLKREKIAALEDGDAEAIVEIDDKVAELKEAKKEEDLQYKDDVQEVKDIKSEIPPEVNAWFANPKNAWYHSDPIRKGIADAVSASYMGENPDADLLDMLKHVDKTVREEMPHKFESAAARTSTVTEKGSRTTRKGKKFTTRDLDEDQKSIAKTFVEMGVFKNAQEYVDELASNGDLV